MGVQVPGYQTRSLAANVHGIEFRLRVLSDRPQFADPGGHADRLGISSAQWSLFGQLWPASRALADAMQRAGVAGKRILGLGCGIGLVSLVLRGHDAAFTRMLAVQGFELMHAMRGTDDDEDTRRCRLLRYRRAAGGAAA